MKLQYPIIGERQLLDKQEWDYLLGLPDILLKQLLRCYAYQAKGWAARYIVFGFETRYSQGRYDLMIEPGTALIEDKIIVSPGGSAEMLSLGAPPTHGDTLCITYAIEDDNPDSFTRSYTVNDQTLMTDPVDKSELTFGKHYSVKRYIPKFVVIPAGSFIDTKTHIPLYQYDSKMDEFVLVKTAAATVMQHRARPILDHEAGSVTREKLIPALSGEGAKTVKATAKREVVLTLKAISDQIKALQGAHTRGWLRIDNNIANAGGMTVEPIVPEEKLTHISTIFREVVKEILLKGVAKAAANAMWYDYEYQSDYTPSIGYIYPRSGEFFLNPEALMHVANGLRATALRGTSIAADNLRFVTPRFAPEEGFCVPLGINPQFQPDFSNIYYFASISFIKIAPLAATTNPPKPATMDIQLLTRAMPQISTGRFDVLSYGALLNTDDTQRPFYGQSNYFFVGLMPWQRRRLG